MTTHISSTELPTPDTPSASLSTAPRGQIRDSEASLFDILIVLAERKLVILCGTMIFGLIATAISLVIPKRFTATVALLPPQGGASTSSVLASQLGSLGGMAALASGGLGVRNPNDLIVGMLRSRTVEDAMVERFGLMQEYHQRYESDARKRFEHVVAVDGNQKDGLIHVSIVDRDPKRAAELANGYVDQLRRLSSQLAITEAAQRRLFFEQQLQQAKDNLANAEVALKQTEQSTGLIQLDSQAKSLIESAASLRAQVAAKEVQLDAIQTFATSENAQYLQAQSELDGLRTQLAKLEGSELSGDSGLIVPKGRVPEAGLQYIRRLRDVKYYETIFDILARQFEVAKLDEAKQGALIQVVDSAVPPDRKSFPRRGFIVIVAAISGLLLSAFFALFQDSWEKMRDDPTARPKLTRLHRSLRPKSQLGP